MIKKKLTYKKAKQQAWDAFSLFIRTRDLKNGCFTCGAKIELKKGQAGHWIPGRHMSVLFDERNTHLQCYHCNVGLKGNPIVYYDKMLKVYGKEVCEVLKEMDKSPRKYKIYGLVALKEYYENL